MLESASPAVRVVAVESRSQAMLGHLGKAVAHLDDTLQAVVPTATLDRLVLLMAKVEILFLDCREEEALLIYTEELDDLIDHVSEEVAIAVSYNRRDISLAMFQPDDFYALPDRSEIADVDLWNYRPLYAGRESAAADKHYEALPVVWEELLRAHNQGCWGPYRLAARQMALECLELGWPQRAIYYAIIAGDKETAQQVGKWLMMNGTPDNLATSVHALLDCANLQRPFVTGCHVISEMHDAIPDRQVGCVVQWLLKKASIALGSLTERPTVEQAWKVLTVIASRADVPQAKAIAKTATTHDLWNAETSENRILPVRKDMLKSIRGCADRLPVSEIGELVTATVPLVLERRQDHDYAEGIELLCHLAECGGSETKEFIRRNLYPRGSYLNSVLLQVATLFDVEFPEEGQLSAEAKGVAERIRLQVQRVPSGGEIQHISGSFGHCTVELGSETLFVHFADTLDLEAILWHRHKLSEEAIDSLLDAIIAMIAERENFISNKIALIRSLGKVGDIRNPERASRLLGMLLPLAKGEFAEPIYAMSSAEAANPLNRFKINLGTPTELRGVALYVLACIERDRPGIFAESLNSVLEAGLMDLDSDIRSWAYTAAQHLPTLTESGFTALILGTQDDEPQAAAAAFFGIANKGELQLQDSQWRMLIQAVGRGAQSRAVRVRQGAALTCERLGDSLPDGPMKLRMAELRTVFSRDTCFSVRRITCE